MVMHFWKITFLFTQEQQAPLVDGGEENLPLEDESIASPTEEPRDHEREEASNPSSEQDSQSSGESSVEDDGPADPEPNIQRNPPERVAREDGREHGFPQIRIDNIVQRIIGGDDAATLFRYIDNLKFRSYQEHVRWSPTLEKCIEGSRDDMIVKMETMLNNVKKIDDSFGLLQHLEIGRQLHCLSERNHSHVYSEASQLCDNRLSPILRKSAAKQILKVTWATYRYPVLSQIRLLWSAVREVLYVIAEYLDKLMLNYQEFPQSIMRAQADRFNMFLRISMMFPRSLPGDGDGLPSSRLTAIHGVYENDRRIQGDDPRAELLREKFRNLVNTEVRTRLIGFDTQETPRTGDEPMHVQQTYWREGRDELVRQLDLLRGNNRSEESMLLLDVFDVDLFGRLTADIRGAHHRQEPAPQPSLPRFEIARRILKTGFAVPACNHYTDDSLMAAFEEARQSKRGGFAEGRNFIHPVQCRRARYRNELKKTHRHRRPYTE